MFALMAETVPEYCHMASPIYDEACCLVGALSEQEKVQCRQKIVAALAGQQAAYTACVINAYAG